MSDTRFIRDAVYSFISFPKHDIVNQIIDTKEFQRLKYIRELGFSYFTYPGALHSRFSHSVGTYWLSHRFGKVLDIDENNQLELEISALLHDIGHGPFSHALEKELIKKNHEEIGREIIESNKFNISSIIKAHNIDPKRISNILSSGAVEPKYLHKLISSQIDVDRFDYLLRDSLMTGNPHGSCDIERIIQTIRRNKNNELFIDDGGCDAVEHYLHCRYQMYKQVYYHHTTLSAEELFKKIIKRSKFLYQNGKLKVEKRFEPFINNSLDIASFLELVDSDLLSLIKSFKDSGDGVLSNLCERFFERKIFKSICLEEDRIIKNFGNEEKIKAVIKKNNFDPDYYYSEVDLTTKRAYLPYSPQSKKMPDEENSIYINEDCSKEISQKIPSLEAIQIKPRIFLFFPNEKCKEEVEKVIR